jgi:hypothetical protein
MPLFIRDCVLCGAPDLHHVYRNDIVTVTCLDCDVVFQIEFDPPDQPDLRARIEILSSP